MRTNIFEDFGKALSDANPVLWKYLNPGMERKQVEKALTKRKVIGNTGPVIDLFAWRNGTNFLNMNEELYNNSSVFRFLADSSGTGGLDGRRMMTGDDTRGDVWAVVGTGEELARDGGAAGFGSVDVRAEGGGDGCVVA